MKTIISGAISLSLVIFSHSTSAAWAGRKPAPTPVSCEIRSETATLHSPEGLYLADAELALVHTLISTEDSQIRRRALDNIRWDQIPIQARSLIIQHAFSPAVVTRLRDRNEATAYARLALRSLDPLWLPFLKFCLELDCWLGFDSIPQRISKTVRGLEKELELFITAFEGGLQHRSYWSKKLFDSFPRFNDWSFFSEKQRNRLLFTADRVPVNEFAQNYQIRKVVALLIQCAMTSGDPRWNRILLSWKHFFESSTHPWSSYLLKKIAAILDPSLKSPPNARWGFQAQMDFLGSESEIIKKVNSAARSGKVFISDHARDRMSTRGLDETALLAALSEEAILKFEKYDANRDSLVFSWRNGAKLKIIFSFFWEDDQEKIFIITAFEPGLRFYAQKKPRSLRTRGF